MENTLEKALEQYIKYGEETRCIFKNKVMLIGNVNEGLWYWSAINDMDNLAYISTDSQCKHLVV